MSYIQRYVVTVTTDEKGKGIGYTPAVTGKVSAIRYVKDSSNAYSGGAAVVVTAEATGETILEVDLDASATFAPRQATHTIDGTPALYDASLHPVRDSICLANDRIKIAVSNGGDTKTGVFHVVIE